MNTVVNNRLFVQKTWGWEEWIVNNDLYCGKILFVKKGLGAQRPHYHEKKHETFYIMSGSLEIVTLKLEDYKKYKTDKLFIPPPAKDLWEYAYSHCYRLNEDDSIILPPYTIHQFRATKNTYVFEVSTHHDDNDVYRLETL